jgi:hypothetical protein
MIELYSTEPHVSIKKSIFTGGSLALITPVSYRLERDGVVVVPETQLSNSDPTTEAEIIFPTPPVGTYTLFFQYQLSNEFGPVSDVFSDTETLIVVTPYVAYSEVLRDYPVFQQYPYSDFRHLERTVRYVINTFCGQSFDRRPDESVLASGDDSDILHLPARLIELTGVIENGWDVFGFTTLSRPGWTLRYTGPYGIMRERNVKADIGTDISMFPRRPFFRSGAQYVVHGTFGWEAVPPMINQAAKLLVWDYAQTESKWRQANVDVIRAADWRMEFASSPISTTGNIDVDLMLSNYTAPNLVVL